MMYMHRMLDRRAVPVAQRHVKKQEPGGKNQHRRDQRTVSVGGVHAFVRHRSLLRRQGGPNIPEAQEFHVATLHAETKLPQRRHDHVKINRA
jgi:hypothetical protein